MSFPAFSISRTSLLQAGLALLTLGLVVALRFGLLTKSVPYQLQAQFGYFAMLGSVLLAGWILLRRLRGFSWRSVEWRAHVPGIVAVVLGSVYLHVHEPHEFRVLYDEPSHVAGSLMMHEERLAVMPGYAHQMYGSLVYFENYPSFRQYLFQFLISLLHDARGYSPDNVFILNAALTPCFLGLLYLGGVWLGGRRGGVLAVLLFVGLPLLAQNVTSGGYDLLNLVMLAGFFLACVDYAKQPGARGLDSLLAVGILLSLSRYESLLFLLAVPVLALWKWREERQVSLTWFATVSPLFVLPNLVSNIIMTTTDSFMLTHVRQGGQAFFDPVNILPHTRDLVGFLFDFDNDSLNSLLLSLAGVLALVALAITCVLRGLRRDNPLPPEVRVTAILSALCAGIYVMILSCFWGSPLDGMAVRFVLPLHWAFAMAAVWFVRDLVKHRPFPRWPLVAAGGFILLCTTPANAKHTTTDMLVISRSFRWFVDYAKAHDHGRTLYVSQSNLPVIIYGYPAIPTKLFNRRLDKLTLALKAGIYDEILIHESLWIDPKDGHEHGNNSELLSDRLETEIVSQQKYLPDQISRIRRFVGYRDDQGKLITPANAEGLRTHFKDGEEQVRYITDLLR